MSQEKGCSFRCVVSASTKMSERSTAVFNGAHAVFLLRCAKKLLFLGVAYSHLGHENVILFCRTSVDATSIREILCAFCVDSRVREIRNTTFACPAKKRGLSRTLHHARNSSLTLPRDATGSQTLATCVRSRRDLSREHTNTDTKRLRRHLPRVSNCVVASLAPAIARPNGRCLREKRCPMRSRTRKRTRDNGSDRIQRRTRMFSRPAGSHFRRRTRCTEDGRHRRQRST